MKRLGLAVALLAPPVVEPAHPQPSAAETAIIRGASASEVLQAWCADHGLPKLVAERTPLNRPADLVVRGALAARPGQAVRHRHVQLVCGGHTLSEADNWYLPDRLTRTMNETLDATDTPFGIVVRPLGFTRRTVAVKRLSNAGHSLEIRAILVASGGAPFSYVVENYSSELTANSGPRTPARASPGWP